MRDSKRIKRITNLLNTIWRKSPDLRLGQLLVILSRKIETNLFNYEDSLLEEDINRYIKSKDLK